MAENGKDDGVAGKRAARDEARRAAEGGLAGTVADLLERVGASAGARAVFGDPVERSGRTVIPVAQAMWGVGAGSGLSEADGAGSGSGGGTMTRPVGYIEITGQGASWVPLQKPWQDVKLVLGWALAIWLVTRALGHLVRR